MGDASLQFVAFGLSVAMVSNLSNSPAWRTAVLLLASVIFVGFLAGSFWSLAPLAGFLLLSYGAIVLLERGLSKVRVWNIWGAVLAYAWLKQYAFLPGAMLLTGPYFILGLSYIFFRVLHMMIEAGDRSGKQPIGLGAYLTYTLNFTTLVSGPIQDYEQFAADQFAPVPISLDTGIVCLQLERIVRGFFKVNVLGTLLHLVQADALAQISRKLPLPLALSAVFQLAVVYPFFLYANFSGYIDIVIALARLMRVRLPENFDRPLSASSFLDFWSRWHITLSDWFKRYVYNPLLIALMRRFSAPVAQPGLSVLAFFVTFFLVGVWHGRTSVFVFYGLLQGAGVSINKLWQLGLARAMGRKGYKALAANPVYVAFGRGLTFSWLSLTLFWFWAGWEQIRQIFAILTVGQWLGVWLAIWICATVVLAGWEMLRSLVLSIRTAAGPLFASRHARVVYTTAEGIAALVLTVLMNQPAPDIIYKNF